METIEYRDESNRLITASQTVKGNTYSELSKVNGYRRKELFFKEGELHHVEYYITNDEIEADVVNQYTNKVVFVFRLIEELNGYRRYDGNVYSPEGIIRQKEIAIFNSDDRIVYSANVSLENESLFNITKWAYGQDGDLEYEFEYNDEGDFVMCNIHKWRDINKNGYFKPQDIGVRPDVFFTWDGYEYYQHAEPKIPKNIIV